LLAASAVALVSARDYAGGWNDGGRLATVESLVDHHTLAIDRSIFVRPPVGIAPYDPLYPQLQEAGTGDKMRIGGHFYYHKGPLPAFPLAALYALLQAGFGLQARSRPDLFCHAMTVASSGLAYVLAVWCVDRLGAALRLTPGWQLALTASFALSTVALPYTRFVNGHIWLLAVAAGVLLLLMRQHWLAAGFLAGFGYAIEEPTGGLLLACAAALPALTLGRIKGACLVVLAALPWLVLHHAITYLSFGTWGPPGADPAVFDYPGSPFDAKDLTGRYNHAHPGDLLVYSAGLLLGGRGFLLSNLPLLLAVPALALLPRSLPERTLARLAAAWCVGTWLVFALLSTNYAGWCCSIRWFVPLLAAGYFLLALLLRERPDCRPDFLVLSAWGLVLAGLMTPGGAWMGCVEYFWLVQAAALASWLLVTGLLPPWVDRVAVPLGVALAGVLLGLLVWRPANLPAPETSSTTQSAWPALLLALGAAVGLCGRARARAAVRRACAGSATSAERSR
jgi:hypothetical protein